MFIDTRPSDDVDILVFSAVLESFFKRWIDVTALESLRATTQNDVTTIGQGSLRQGKEGVAPHDDRMTGGEGLETLQVVGKPIDQLVLIADGSVSGYSRYDGNHNS